MKIIKFCFFLCCLMIGIDGFSQQILNKEKPGKKKNILFRDSDGDGVFDSRDDCPNMAGPRALRGCPDTDGDGIADKDDKCIDVAGVDKYGGCPVPDTDGDGINDEEDGCINEKGTVENKGCPEPEKDSDGDGVLDKNDNCPDVPGVKSNAGCPPVEVKKEAPKVDKNANDSVTYRIFFDYDIDQISNDGFKVLKHIVDILKGDPALKAMIRGHDDNIGIAAINIAKSSNRAKMVKEYFMSYYIGENRMSSSFHGADMPLDKTQQWLNRRVEIILYK